AAGKNGERVRTEVERSASRGTIFSSDIMRDALQ
ncbi:MAG: hypothetical protein RIS70_2993, partial [Planctomycetota bacterium]